MRKLKIFFAFFFFCSVTIVYSQNYKIVIDAGHGGRDPGNLASLEKYENEKNLNLKIAKELGELINSQLKDVTIIYTRESDKFVRLDDRVYIANKNSADYFISIHCNSNINKTIHGSRIHIHNGNFGQSKNLAQKIVNQLEKTAGRKNLGVQDSQQRGGHYFVLQNTAMPAVLVECGFMTNSNEERFLNSENGQKLIAHSIYKGLKDFLYNEAESKVVVIKNDKNELSIITKDFYKVQISASVEAIPKARFNNLNMSVYEEFFPDNIFKYKYFVGTKKTFSEAKELRNSLIKKGYKDAFIVKDDSP